MEVMNKNREEITNDLVLKVLVGLSITVTVVMSVVLCIFL